MDVNWSAFFRDRLRERSEQGLHRKRGGGRPSVDGPWIDFGTNDYLGLADDPQVLQALRAAARAGSGASPVLTGHGTPHQCLESKLAEWSGCSSALVFSSGYAANVGTLACLAGPGDLIFSDQLNHASLIDGCRQSRASVEVYPHNDVQRLAELVRQTRHQYAKVLVVTEAVFSMDGDQAALSELSELAMAYECGLVVDEAHAAGVYGPEGNGLSSQLPLANALVAKLGTLSKALGTVGGYVCGSEDLIEYLVNHCRSYMFSTAAAPPMMAAALAGLQRCRSMDARRTGLRQASVQLRTRLRSLGWQVADGDSPIVPVIVGSESRALQLSQELLRAGIWVPAIRPPTVPVGASRLRISLSVRHSTDQIDQMCQVFERLSGDSH